MWPFKRKPKPPPPPPKVYKFPPFNFNTVCPKCGEKDHPARVKLCAGLNCAPGFIHGIRYGGTVPEHLCRTCVRCGCLWQEACVEPAGAPPKLPEPPHHCQSWGGGEWIESTTKGERSEGKRVYFCSGCGHKHEVDLHKFTLRLSEERPPKPSPPPAPPKRAPLELAITSAFGDLECHNCRTLLRGTIWHVDKEGRPTCNTCFFKEGE